MFDKFKEECGLIGITDHKEASNLAYLGLYAQQHRGQEGAGIVAKNNSSFSSYRGLGLVADVFENFDFGKLPGNSSIGHVRYTTAGSNHLDNVQPFFADLSHGGLALAHNGNLINVNELRKKLISNGSIFRSTSDTEIILHLIANSKSENYVEKIKSAVSQIKGAYSLLMMFEKSFFALRDPNGLRPLAIGKIGNGFCFASETCAFDLIGAEYLRDVEPGELVEITNDQKLVSYSVFNKVTPSPCIFEYIYFARPDSKVFNKNVYRIRHMMGQKLAQESHVDADIVIPVPDSGVPAALGYAYASKIPFDYGLIRNHYVGRTFIEPQQTIRDFGVKIKLNPNTEVLEGKRVIVIDDSIVRGTTSRKLINMLKSSGAKEVHMRISAPPTTDPCYYGIDTPEKSQLIAAYKSVNEIKEYLEVDSLAYLSLEGLYASVDSVQGQYCDACFTGNYPIGISD